MGIKLIKLEDGTLIEVNVPGEYVEQISGGMADKVNSTLDRIKPILINTSRPIIDAWAELSQEMQIEQAEIELDLSFEGEGNIYVTKTKPSANLSIKLILKPAKD